MHIQTLRLHYIKMCICLKRYISRNIPQLKKAIKATKTQWNTTLLHFWSETSKIHTTNFISSSNIDKALIALMRIIEVGRFSLTLCFLCGTWHFLGRFIDGNCNYANARYSCKKNGNVPPPGSQPVCCAESKRNGSPAEGMSIVFVEIDRPDWKSMAHWRILLHY